tara:strand:- start:1328 stop:1957 length:630 start_codon:yes stop_codon:yes gene_type:complete
MAYGKIKADAIIYDDSGSDVEKTIASLAAAASTASPTFTGTVTVPTASANDSTTKAASTAFVMTELGDYLTTATATSTYAPKAGPTFTGTLGAATITATGVVSDLKGDVRTIPQLSKSSGHVIVAADSGKHSINSSGGWTFNTSTGFTAGQAITLLNNSGSDQTITATGVTLYNTADAATGTRTLAGRGMATVICTASNTYYISGSGLS